MADPTLFHSLTLEGFRAYLQPKTFDFSKKPSLNRPEFTGGWFVQRLSDHIE